MRLNLCSLLPVIVSTLTSSAVDAQPLNAPESSMFRGALQDSTMQHLVRENFYDPNIVVVCAVLSLQWRSGRIVGSDPFNPGSPDVPLLMYGMLEATSFAVTDFPSEKVQELTLKALEKFENSADFRDTAMSVCSTAMVAPLRYVMQKYNLIR